MHEGAAEGSAAVGARAEVAFTEAADRAAAAVEDPLVDGEGRYSVGGGDGGGLPIGGDAEVGG